MPVLELSDIRILLNAVFVFRDDPITHGHIHAIVSAAKSNADREEKPFISVFREPLGEDETKVTAFAFYSIKDAQFAPQKDIVDTTASYIVIIEVDNYLAAIFKKGGAGIKSALNKNFYVVDYDDLLKTFEDSKSEIQKLSAREMNISDRGLRYRSYEAPDLKGHMSPHAAGRSIPKFTRIKSKNETSSLGLTSGRINQLTDRADIGKAAAWAKSKFSLIDTGRTDNSFFSSFAQRVELETALETSRPASILFERASIEDDINSNNLDISYVSRKGVLKTAHPKLVKRILSSLNRAFEIEAGTNRLLGTRNAKLRINKKTLSPQSKTLQRLKVGDGLKDETLQSWITSNGYFTVSFDRPEYIYVDKHCFYDRAGKSEVESLLKCLEIKTSLNNLKGEKGFPKPDPDSVEFPRKSLFRAVEKIHSKESFIFCDDLGDEWADHICLDIKSARVTFVHSKYDKPSNSASALHEVVGQAIKNLGNMHFTSATFSKKVNNKFKNKYSNTRISRTRAGDPSLANAAVKTLIGDHRLHRKCVIACPYLSKESVSEEFRRMKDGLPVRGHITQLFWIISSYVHAVIGASVVPVIYCRK